MDNRVSLEYIKKHTILYAAEVVRSFHQIEQEHHYGLLRNKYFELHEKCFEYITQKNHHDSRSIKFSLALYKIITLFHSIALVTERLVYQKNDHIFKAELTELHQKVVRKMNETIDCFSYSDISKAQQIYENQTELAMTLNFYEQKIQNETKENYKYCDDGFQSIKAIHYFKEIDKNLMLVVENVLHIEQKLSTNSQDIGHLNMIDFIKMDQLIETGEHL